MSVEYQEMCELEFAETENPYTPEELRQILSTELSVFLDNGTFIYYYIISVISARLPVMQPIVRNRGDVILPKVK